MTTSIQSPFQTPNPSRATRMISPRSKASLRGALVAKLPADKFERKLAFESKLEEQVLHLLLARTDVYDIWDQPPEITYQGYDGKCRKHTFDFLVTKTDGRGIAVAVKPEAKVVSLKFRDELRFIRKGVSQSYADDVALITDQCFSRSDALNAARLQQFRQQPDIEADEVILELFRSRYRECTVCDAVEVSGLDGRAFRAIFRAIYTGAAKVLDAGLINYRTRIAVGEI